VYISNLVIAMMHPINRTRLETHVAILQLKELPIGFRVTGVNVSPIDTLPEKLNRPITEKIASYEPGKAGCISIYDVEAVSEPLRSHFDSYGLGDYADMTAVRDQSASLSDRQGDLIKLLNKEVMRDTSRDGDIDEFGRAGEQGTGIRNDFREE
jgi:hypothetical protein